MIALIKETSIEEINVGDMIITKSKWYDDPQTYQVCEKGYTILHKHPYLKIIRFGMNGLEETHAFKDKIFNQKKIKKIFIL